MTRTTWLACAVALGCTAAQGLFGLLHSAGERISKRERALAKAAALGNFVQRLFRIVDLCGGRNVDRRLIGGIDDFLADTDQRAAHREVRENARVILHVWNDGRVTREIVQIRLATDLRQTGVLLHR